MIRFEKRGNIGVAVLSRESALNTLNLEMVTALRDQLALWQTDPSVATVVLLGAGPKAFCSGGDVKTVVQRACQGDLAYGEDFFRVEYQLDYAIHRYPKPIVVLAHGYVMGGGIGLLAGASHRVLTAGAVLAMPEISIGLFADVGGSYFLNRLPGKLGLFAALTACRFNATDAIDAGLADFCIADGHINPLIEKIAGENWASDAGANRSRMTELLNEFSLQFIRQKPAAQLKGLYADIDRALSHAQALECFESLRNFSNHPAPILSKAAAVFEKGSPTSAHLIFEQLRRGKNKSLQECFEMELGLAVACCKRHDFREGVRAVLIDKDQCPQWIPKGLGEISKELIDAHFTEPIASFLL